MYSTRGGPANKNMTPPNIDVNDFFFDTLFDAWFSLFCSTWYCRYLRHEVMLQDGSCLSQWAFEGVVRWHTACDTYWFGLPRDNTPATCSEVRGRASIRCQSHFETQGSTSISCKSHFEILMFFSKYCCFFSNFFDVRWQNKNPFMNYWCARYPVVTRCDDLPYPYLPGLEPSDLFGRCLVCTQGRDEASEIAQIHTIPTPWTT